MTSNQTNSLPMNEKSPNDSEEKHNKQHTLKADGGTKSENPSESTLQIEKDWDGTTVIRRNIPKEGPLITSGGGSQPVLEIDAQQEGYPSPKMFHDLSCASSKMLALSMFLPDAYQDEAKRIWEDIDRLRKMLARERFSDQKKVGNLCINGISELPEVQIAGTEKIEGEEYEEEP